MKKFSLYLFVAVIIFGQLMTPEVAEAATFNFTQSSWAGGATATTAVHPGNQTNWTQYSAGSGVTAGANVQLTSPTSYAFTDDGTASTSPTSPIASGGGFSNGTNSGSAVSGSGATASVGINPIITPINAWTTLTSSAPGGINIGSSMIRNGADNDIYITQGSGSTNFYKYSISGNSWTTLTAVPAAISDGSKMIRNGADNDIYVTRGGGSAAFYKYSISGNSWTTLAVAPAIISSGSNMIRNSSDNDIYVTGGGGSAAFYKYSISGNIWTTLTAASVGISDGNSIIRNASDNDIYITPGWGQNNFLKYSISGNSWTTLTAAPGTIGGGSSMIRNGSDNDIYVTRGGTNTSFYKYSISGNSWTTLTAAPAAIGDGSRMIRNGADNEIYITLGSGSTSFYKYSISGNSWTILTAVPAGIGAGSNMIRNSSDNDIYITGGGVSPAFYKYSISGNSWTTLVSASPITDAGSTMIRNGADNDIYVTAGVSTAFYKYSISDNSWTTLTVVPGGISIGSSMIRNASDNDIYLTKSGTSTAFYKYSILGNSWTTLTVAPGSIGDGSRMIRNGSDNDIYVTRGGTNTSFYKYSISGNSWTTLAVAPASIFTGSSMIRNGADNDIYITPGWGQNNFLKYSISGNSWTTLTAVPAAISTGSSMIRNGADNDIYITPGNGATSFYKYSISGNSWTTLAVAPGAIGLGSSMIRNGSDNDIYVTRGGTNTSFYKYSISGNSWTTLAVAPAIIGSGSNMIRNSSDNDIYVTGGGVSPGFYKFVINSASSYASTATFTSAVLDTGANAGFTSMSYTTTLPATTAVAMDVRGSLDNVTWTGWTTGVASGGSIASLAGNRYIQYRANLSTGNSSVTPLLNSVTVNYTQYAASGNLTSSIYDSGDAGNFISKVSWSATGASSTETVQFQARSSPDGSTWSAWCGYADCSGATYFNATDNNVSFATNHPLRNGANDRYMQYKVFLASGGAATPVLTSASLQYVVNAPPTFNTDYPSVGAGGATAAQNANPVSADLGKVNISYSAMDTDTTSGTNTPNQMTPSFEYSVNGGSSWAAIPSNNLASGDTSIKTISGSSFTTYNAVWSAATTVPGINIANAKVRVTVNDNEAASNTATAVTANFSLDTKAPVGIINFDAGVAGEAGSGIVYITLPTDQNAVQYLISDNPVTQTSPATTGWSNITATTTIPWTFDSDIEVKSLKYQFRDSLGNTMSEVTVSTHIPVPSGSFLVQDISNVSPPSPYYDLYIGWQLTDAAQFSSYKLEQATSADGVTYSAYSPITSASFSDVTTNYFVYRGLDPNTFYRLRMGVVDTNGNTSVRSYPPITTKPDGVQNFGEGGGGSVLIASKVENVVVAQNSDKTVNINYKLTDASSERKVAPSYEAYIFYNLGITLPNNALVGDTLALSDASRLQTSGFIQINNEVIKYTGKSGNTLTGITRGTWPTDVSAGRTTRINSLFFSGTPVWILATGTTPISITDNTIASGQDNSISWNTAGETGLLGNTYSNIGVRVLVHDNQDSLSGPLSSQNDFSENGILSLLDLSNSNTAFNAIKSTSAIITWITVDYSDSTVEYGTVLPGEIGEYNLSKTNAEKVVNHRIYLNNLIPSTKYYFKTTSADLDGVVTTSESDFTTTPGPVLSSVSSGNLTDTSGIISWTTDIPSTSYVTFSTVSDLTSPIRIGSNDLVTSHSVLLSSLGPVKTYYYKVESSDAIIDGNLGEETNNEAYYVFTTLGDMTSPIISEISVPIITSTEVAIVWKTSELANGKVRYGIVSGSYDNETTLITTPVSNHLATISGLTKSTRYYFVTISADESGNLSTSPEQTFSTTEPDVVIVTKEGAIGVAQLLYDNLLAENEANKAKIKIVDSDVPVVSNIQISGISAFGATVFFETNEDTIAFIQYGKDHTYGLMGADNNWSKTHTVKLSGLSLGADYFIKVMVLDKSINIGTSEEQTFKTKFLTEDLAELQSIDNIEQFQAEIEATIESILPSLIPPFIDKPVVSDITENSATVSFRTNIRAFPIISYASDSSYDTTKTNPYDGEISDTSEKSVLHTLSLIGLNANTKYHAMAKAFSLPKVIGKSDDFTFTTAASKIQGSVVGVKKDSFTVVWVTTEPTSSIVEYKNLKTGRSSRVVDETKNTSHSVLIENLSPGTSYQVGISGINENGNLIEGGSSINVKTSLDNIPPVITNLKVDSSLIVGRTDRVQTIISWHTDEPSTSVVFYEEGSGSPDKALANKQEDLELTMNHVVILTTLKPGTVYRFTESSQDDAGNTVQPPIRTIITPKKIESIMDVIFKNFNDTFDFVNNVR